MPSLDKIMRRKRAIIESVTDQLKSISQIEHSRLRRVANCFVNLVAGLAAHTWREKKPGLNIRVTERLQLVFQFAYVELTLNTGSSYKFFRSASSSLIVCDFPSLSLKFSTSATAASYSRLVLIITERPLLLAGMSVFTLLIWYLTEGSPSNFAFCPGITWTV